MVDAGIETRWLQGTEESSEWAELDIFKKLDYVDRENAIERELLGHLGKLCYMCLYYCRFSISGLRMLSR